MVNRGVFQSAIIDENWPYYCTPLQVAQISGVAIEVFNESLGTGDGSTNSYDLANNNVISGSYIFKYGEDGSNDLSDLYEDVHYTFDKDRGMLLLTSSGVTLIENKKLFVDYVYCTRVSNSFVERYIQMATAEVEKATNDYYGLAASATEYFDGYTHGYPTGEDPYGYDPCDTPEFQLKYSGVQSITNVYFLDKSGDVSQTLTSSQYRVITDDTNHEGRLLINTSIPNGKGNVKVVYSHGYDQPPILIQELAACIAGVVLLVNIAGGSYKDISSYSFPEGSVSIGQIYVNVRESIDQLRKRADYILSLFGNNYACV